MTWSVAIPLNTDQANSNNVVQWMPSISVTDQGYVLATWYDRGNTTDGTNYQYYGRLSLDNDILVTWTDGRNAIQNEQLEPQDEAQMDVFFRRVPLCPSIGVAAGILPNAELTVAYDQTVAGTGGKLPYTFALAGLLPDGLTLNAGSGEITGFPTVPGTFNFEITAQDDNGCFGSQSHTLVINSVALGVIFKDSFE